MLTYATDYDSYYTSTAHRCVFINLPRIFDSVLQIALSLVSRRTGDIIKSYGSDKKEWTAALLKTIAPDQLPKAYGGTME